ncbi:hypothetical protein V3C99_012797 [Haemonchus contortus]
MLTLYIRLAYSIPSVILYILVIMAVYKEKQRFHRSFYSLLIVQAVTNFFVFVNGFYVVYLASETNEQSWWKVIYTDAPQLLIRVGTCLGTHFLFVQTYMTFFISLNRMTAILWPLKHELMWTYGLPVCVLITYLTPFYVTFPYLTHPIAFVYSPETKCYIATSETALIFVFRYGLESFNSRVILMLIPYASDVYTLSTPYLIIILNKRVRSRLMGYLGCECIKCLEKTTRVQDAVLHLSKI